jgi:hypothetical protein
VDLSTPSRPAEHPATTTEHERPLWLGFLVPPLAFLANLGVAYALVPGSCAGGVSWPLHLTAAVMLIIALGAGWLAWREWARAGREWPSEQAEPTARIRFMAALGSIGAVFFSLLIVAQWLAMVILPQCRR